MIKEELEKEAEIFVSEKADKGNFDLEQFGKAYFSESSMKQALIKFTEQRKVHTEIEINGIRFSNISEMLRYMDKQRERIAELEAQIEKMKSALIDIRSNTDDVNIEWQIKYLFDELEIKENG